MPTFFLLENLFNFNGLQKNRNFMEVEILPFFGTGSKKVTIEAKKLLFMNGQKLGMI
jgi:hypothetical protein